MRRKPHLRERKKERTRTAIVEAAWAQFRQKGYEGTTVDEIAEAALISPRTFFRYFTTKEAVVFHRANERLELLQALLAEGGKGFESVTRACLGIAGHFLEHRDEVVEQYRLVESSPTLMMAEGEIDRRWLQAIASALAERRSPTAERKARILAGAVFGAMRATLAEWVGDDGRSDLVQLGTQALAIFG